MKVVPFLRPPITSGHATKGSNSSEKSLSREREERRSWKRKWGEWGSLWVCAVMTSACRIVCAHPDLDEPHHVSRAGSSPKQGRENATWPTQPLTSLWHQDTGADTQCLCLSYMLTSLSESSLGQDRPFPSSLWGKTTGNRLIAVL